MYTCHEARAAICPKLDQKTEPQSDGRVERGTSEYDIIQYWESGIVFPAGEDKKQIVNLPYQANPRAQQARNLPQPDEGLEGYHNINGQTLPGWLNMCPIHPQTAFVAKYSGSDEDLGRIA